MPTKGIRTYLGRDLTKEVARIARAQGRSESAVIADAVRRRLAEDSPDATEAAKETQRRQLNRIERRLDKLLNDQALIKESLFIFVRVWLEHNPPIDEEIADAIAASASERFERFLDLLMKGINPGQSIAAHALDAESNASADAAQHEQGVGP